MTEIDQVPIGDDERDATVTLLHAHMNAGHIDRQQLDQRLVWVRSADSKEELDQVLAGLPDLPQGAVAAVTQPRRPPWRRVMMWMIALSPLLFLLIMTGWSFWWAFYVLWGVLFFLVYRIDRASEKAAP